MTQRDKFVIETIVNVDMLTRINENVSNLFLTLMLVRSIASTCQ